MELPNLVYIGPNILNGEDVLVNKDTLNFVKFKCTREGVNLEIGLGAGSVLSHFTPTDRIPLDLCSILDKSALQFILDTILDLNSEAL
jgi:hypothetical protein